MAKRLLIYGYGNPGRQDDGLGNAVVEKLGKWIEENGIEDVDIDSNYQLNIEDADTIKDYKTVIFVDATIEDIDNFKMTRVEASDASIEFTMHAVSPSFVLDLCKKLYNKTPDTYLLHIKGYEWDFAEGLSTWAERNMVFSFLYLKSLVLNPELNPDTEMAHLFV